MKRFLLALAALAALSITPAQAALQVDVTQGNAQPLPIAIPDFIGDAATGANIAGVVRADLERGQGRRCRAQGRQSSQQD